MCRPIENIYIVKVQKWVMPGSPFVVVSENY